MIVWEYLTVQSSEPLSEDRLCEYGALGWELCSEMAVGCLAPAFIARFKRREDDDLKFDMSGVPLPAEATGEQRAMGRCRP